MAMSITLPVVMVSGVHAYVQTHPIIYVKYVQVFLIYHLYLKKVVLEKRETFILIDQAGLRKREQGYGNV